MVRSVNKRKAKERGEQMTGRQKGENEINPISARKTLGRRERRENESDKYKKTEEDEKEIQSEIE